MRMHENRTNTMDSFYEEGTPQFNAVQQNGLKRPLTLDLNGSKQQVKKQRFNQSVTTPAVLSTPDLQMLKMATPELEKFIIGLPTPTPIQAYPTNNKVTSEQEEYARGFVEALHSLQNSENNNKHQQHQQQPPQPQQQQQPTNNFVTTVVSSVTSNNGTGLMTTAPTTTSAILSNVGMSGGSITYTNLDESFPVQIKDEPQTVPSSPPMSPIDMESQERIKLERKRQRNRVAASKCRKRKLERISKLEDKVKAMKAENVELGSVVKSLKEHVCQLKQQVIDHMNNGCNIPVYNVPYFKANESDIKQ